MGETTTLLALLQRHYIKPGADLPGGVFLPEVGWNPAGGASGRDGGCDAIYVGFTGSSGRLLVGHELKISRADWLNELNKPGKADAWADQCHEWWLVVNDPAIVHTGELPAGWGLMSPGVRSKTRMTAHTTAERKPAGHAPSWHAVRSIMARQDTLRSRAVAEIRDTARDDARKDLNKRVDVLVDQRMQRQPEAAVLERRLKLVEAALGGQIDWGAEERGYVMSNPNYVGLAELELIADAVRAAGSVQSAIKHLTGGYANPVHRTRQALDQLDKALAELRGATQSKEVTA